MSSDRALLCAARAGPAGAALPPAPCPAAPASRLRNCHREPCPGSQGWRSTAGAGCSVCPDGREALGVNGERGASCWSRAGSSRSAGAARSSFQVRCASECRLLRRCFSAGSLLAAFSRGWLGYRGPARLSSFRTAAFLSRERERCLCSHPAKAPGASWEGACRASASWQTLSFRPCSSGVPLTSGVRVRLRWLG